MDGPEGESYFLMWGKGSEIVVFLYLLPNFDFRDLSEGSRVAWFLLLWCAQGRGGYALHPHPHSLSIHSFCALQRELWLFHISLWTKFSFVERDIF